MSSHLIDNEDETKDYSNRYRILYAALIISSLVLLSRLWYLQIIEGQKLRAYSEKNRVKETKIPAPRGLILDRSGRVLVDNLPGFVAIISPQYATELEQTAKAISPILDIPANKIVKMVKKSRRRNGPFRAVKIKENLSLDEVVRIKHLRFDHTGLDIQESILRHYPLNEMGAQLFGYVGEVSRSQMEKFNSKRNAPYRLERGDIIGKRGLEESWENTLRGEKGLSFVEVDARGRLASTFTPSFLGLQRQEATTGNNVMLTLDMDMQRAAKEAMEIEDKVGPRIGSLVAMKSNGEIIAWLSRPSFNPNEFSTGISSELWSRLLNDRFKPLHNKVIKDNYSPGSTFKPIVALAALQEEVITPSTVINAPGVMRFGRRLYHDSVRGGHGNITVHEAIERSSNIFFYKMGIALGIDKMAEYAKLLGIGARTNIQLANEAPGLMPTSQWKKKTYGEAWQPGENLSNAIGQGFVLTTALQLGIAYNTIAREGEVVKPFLVKKIIDNENNVLKEFFPEVLRDISQVREDGPYIDKKHFKTVKEAMRRVANGTRGTARYWKIPGVQMAGKTGTTQVMAFSADEIYKKCETRPIKQRHHGWFVAWAPPENPEITVAVFAEHGCHGNTAGAPVVRSFIWDYFHKYHPELVPKPRPKHKPKPKVKTTVAHEQN